MEPMFPPPNPSGKSGFPAKMSGRWVIALALLFLVMVARHHGGHLASVARHQVEKWLTQTTQISGIPQSSGIRQRAQGLGSFVMPIAKPKIYQTFGWDVKQHPAQFHSDIIVGNPQDVTVISGIAGQVAQVTAHSLEIRSNHTLITYGDLHKITVKTGKKISPYTTVAQLGSAHRMTIEITDQGLPVNPLLTSFFGPETSFREH